MIEAGLRNAFMMRCNVGRDLNWSIVIEEIYVALFGNLFYRRDMRWEIVVSLEVIRMF